MAQLEAGLDDVRTSPKDEGVLQLIVRRPERGERELVDEGRNGCGARGRQLADARQHRHARTGQPTRSCR